MVTVGLECLLRDPVRWLHGARVGFLTNPTAVDSQLEHAIDRFHADSRIDLRLLFGPEHGLRGAAQDMVDVGDTRDPITGLREVSLYGPTFDSLSPQEEHLREIDVLVYDVQDVGSRYYTYAATLALCMQAAGRHGVRVVVLDRPNPINGVQVEGGGLVAGLENFCALYPIPQRHGLTVGELAHLYRNAFAVSCDLDIVPCEGWRRTDPFDSTGLPWVMPSPNMPTLDTAWVYPGMCLLEGTNLSEGRGTTRPFELFGAPFVDPHRLRDALISLDLPGAVFRPCYVQPMFQKHAGKSCGALQLHITDRRTFLPYRTGLAILWATRQLWPDLFAWRSEPYEFRADVPAIDLLTGAPSVREAIDTGAPFEQVVDQALGGTEAFDQHRSSALLYD